MNPFSPNQPEQITEQDLLALHFNELPPARAAAVRRIIARDPVLAAESASIAAALAAVTLNAKAANARPLPLNHAILDRNWQAIQPKLASHTPTSFRWHIAAFPAFAAGLLAAIAVGIALLAHNHHPAAPTFTQLKSSTQEANENPTPPISHSPIVTASPDGQADLHRTEPGSSANLSSGVYRPKSRNPNAPIHLLGPAFPPTLAADSPTAEPFRQPLLTLVPTPRLTPEPPPSLLGPIAVPDQPQPHSEPPQIVHSSKPAAQLRAKSRHPHQLDVMFALGAMAIPVKNSPASTTRTTTITRSTVDIASLHQQLRPALGYRVALSYTRSDFSYIFAYPGSSTLPPGIYGTDDINSRVFEAAGTYVIQGPHHKRLSTSAEAGGALMAFLPTNHSAPSGEASYSLRGAGVFGINVDYAIGKHIGARVSYRANLFRSPDFDYNGGTFLVTTPLVLDNEPTLGVTYTFGKR